MRFDELFAPRKRSVCHAKWVWCMHCGEAHRRLAWEENDLDCPTPGCDGMAFDAVPWAEVRKQNPDYPQVPEEGVCYPMYPPRR